MHEFKQEEFISTSLPSDLIKKTTEFLAPIDTVNLWSISKDFNQKIVLRIKSLSDKDVYASRILNNDFVSYNDFFSNLDALFWTVPDKSKVVLLTDC